MSAAKDALTGQQSLWTPAFTLLCFTVLLGYAHHALLVPTIPLFVADQGGTATMAGLALLTFSIPSFALRPWVGEAADKWSAAGVLSVGLICLMVGGFLYILPVLALVFVASAIRGLGWAGVNTGGYTMLATAAPDRRRGEAAGYYASITTSATIIFPATALWLIGASFGGFNLVFLVSGVVALIGLLISHGWLRPMVPNPVRADAAAHSSGAKAGLIDRSVLLATALNLGSSLVSPAVIGFLPLYARELGIGQIGFFYVVAGATSIIIRPLLGRQSDSIGRGPAIAFGFISMAIGLLLIAVADGLPMLLLGGVFTTLGTAINGSTTTALAMDLADPGSRGRGMATFSLSFQVGAGVGALLAGGMADLVGYRAMYLAAIGVVAAASVLLTANWRRLRKEDLAGIETTGGTSR